MVALPRRRCRLSDATRIRQIGGHGAEIELSKGVVHHWRTPLRHRLSRNHIASLSSASYSSPPQMIGGLNSLTRYGNIRGPASRRRPVRANAVVPIHPTRSVPAGTSKEGPSKVSRPTVRVLQRSDGARRDPGSETLYFFIGCA